VPCLSIRSAKTQFDRVHRHPQISSRGEGKSDNAPLCLKAVALDELKPLMCAFLPVNVALFTSTSSKPQRRLSDSPAVFGPLEERVACLAPAKRWEVPMLHELVVVHLKFSGPASQLMAAHPTRLDSSNSLAPSSSTSSDRKYGRKWRAR
jgi:hypothetical protein